MKKNKDLKKVYTEVFKKGYENVYTSFKISSKPTDEIMEVLKESTWKGKDVLDVGCGEGQFAYLAARKGACIIGLDYIPEAIETAKSRYNHKNLEYKVGDAEKIEGLYDVIVSIGTLEHMTNPEEVLEIFKKHLKPKGKIIITSPNWTNPRGYVLMTLFHLFDAPITLADLHYLTPMNFKKWAKKMRMSIKWRTFDHSWGNGDKMIKDFDRRITNVLRDAKLPNKKKNIQALIDWLKEYVVPEQNEMPHTGALGIYIFSKK